MNKLTQATCPICKKTDTWQPDNKFRPFCSERCKLIDLGEWATDAHVIIGEPTMHPTDDEQNEDQS